ncbi:MAG: transglutaminase domain-containing protein [Planctomycetaceae bacterium]|nr:transglutaminase domain-containing protein [Planctomycetaceae bacterium]
MLFKQTAGAAPSHGDRNGRRQPPRMILLLVLLGSLGFEVIAGDGAASRTWILGILAVQTLLVFGVGRLACRWNSPTGELSPVQLPLILLLGAAPFLLNPLDRLLTGEGRPLELLMLAGFRNASLTLAAVALTPALQRTAAALSVFLVLFCVSLGDDPFLLVLLFVFTLSGVGWLMGSYWSTLEGRLADETRHHRPLALFLLLPALAVLAIVLIPHSGRSAIEALPGLVPTSGGTGQFSPEARSGVGDGDMLVAGTRQVQSFAPIEDAPFMDSNEAGLYDVFNELYDEPVRPRNQDRSMALPPELMMDIHRHLAKSEQAGREFSTLRKSSGKHRDRIADRTTEALFFVAGRTPLHLRTELRSIFDGIDWYSDSPEPNKPPLAIRTIDGKPWLDLSRGIDADIAGPAESHAVKIARLRTDRIPTPACVTGIHIDLVDQADLFAWAHDGQLRMVRESIPPQTVIHVASRTIDRRRLEENGPPAAWGELRYRQLPDTSHMTAIRSLAARWTAGLSRGWPQVDAVMSQLRSGYVCDPAQRPPTDCTSPVSHFLFTARRGPDYQFATAAALMLRSLGYSTRIASGFYVRPESYDVRSRHTPVCTDDGHFWVEISLGRDIWIPLEPTPGYELLLPPVSLLARLGRAVVNAGLWLVTHPLLCLSIVALSITCFLLRNRLADTADEWRWRLWRHHSWRGEVLAAVRLLDRRLNRAGWKRPPGTPAVAWIERHLASLPGGCPPELRQVLSLAEAAAWAPDVVAADLIGDVATSHSQRRMCRCVLCRLGLGELIRHRASLTKTAQPAIGQAG